MSITWVALRYSLKGKSPPIILRLVGWKEARKRGRKEARKRDEQCAPWQEYRRRKE
jgi:hypothetical protein